MKPIKEMSDQELNEWLALNVMGWNVYEGAWYCDGIHTEYHKIAFYEYEDDDSIIWNPTQDLNQAFMVQEKVFGSCSDGSPYIRQLEQLLAKNRNDLTSFALIFATARQRCEAAYLTFGGKSETE